MKKTLLFLAASASILAMSACGIDRTTQSSDTARASQVEELQKAAVREVPAPAIINFQELKWQTFLLELKDKAFGTYSYIMALDGTLIYVCPSLGYGMNSSVQTTNPEKVISASVDDNDGEANLAGRYNYTGLAPQPEPNGLFMPEGLASTYAMCDDRNGDGMPDPLYLEPDIIVSMSPLPHDKSWWTGK